MNNGLISRPALLRTCEGEEAEMGATWDYEGLKAAIELAPPPWTQYTLCGAMTA